MSTSPMRLVIAAAALFLLAACGQDAPPAPAANDAAKQQGPVILNATRNLPDWLFILRTSDGGTIHFNQRTITRNPDGTADIWLQVRYGSPQLWRADDAAVERVIRYEVERVHYRFNCAQAQFVIAERQIMGANETVVARYEPPQVWRDVPEAGASPHVLPIACRGN